MTFALALLAAASSWWPQPAGTGGGAFDSRDEAGRWERRLEALSPADPMAYFELAEEVADTAGSESQVALARHLFGLAGALDPQRLGRSACLAIADLEPNEYAKRRLLALGALLDRRAGGFAGRQPVGVVAIHPEAALAVSEALSYYRKGEGARALKLLDEPGRHAVHRGLPAVSRVARADAPAAGPGGVSALRGRPPGRGRQIVVGRPAADRRSVAHRGRSQSHRGGAGDRRVDAVLPRRALDGLRLSRARPHSSM
ncbi:MAG: hypothetical protein ACYTAQ_09945 [Planctomycetota bacterium]